MRVCEAKRLIHDVCGLVKEFREHPEKRDELRKGIGDVLGLFSSEVVCELAEKLKKIKKKRLREKKRRCSVKNVRREITEDRRVKEKEIDGNLQRNQENEARLRVRNTEPTSVKLLNFFVYRFKKVFIDRLMWFYTQ